MNILENIALVLSAVGLGLFVAEIIHQAIQQIIHPEYSPYSPKEIILFKAGVYNTGSWGFWTAVAGAIIFYYLIYIALL